MNTPETPSESPATCGDCESLRHSPRRIYFMRAAIVGSAAGLLGVGFRHALTIAESTRDRLLQDLHGHPAWGWLVLPLIGLAVGCAVGWCTRRWAPEAAGSGIPHLKGVLLHMRTLSWSRLIPVKFIGGVVGIGAGLSLGREGPTVQMGAAAAQALATGMRTPQADIPQLLSAGAGAGLAAAFNAPLAGLLFVIEELHRELSSRTAVGALVAVVCATVITKGLAGDTPSFEVHDLTAMSLGALPLAAAVGLLGGLGGAAYNFALLRCQRAVLSQQSVPRWAWPGIVAAIAGLMAWWLPEAVGGGHAVAERVLDGSLRAGLSALVLLLLTKYALTVLSYGSGAPGGIFAPMLLLGALCGAACAEAASRTLPNWAVSERTLPVLGMAAFFVSSVRAPLTGIALICEMTGGYQLLFPVCIASLVAYLVGEALRSPPIYDALLKADLERSGYGEPCAEPRSVYIAIQSCSPLAGKQIARAGLPRGCLVVAMERGGVSMLPTADTVLLAGDHVSILTPGDSPQMPLEVVRLCTGL